MGGTVICGACDLGRCRYCGVTVFVYKKEIDGKIYTIRRFKDCNKLGPIEHFAIYIFPYNQLLIFLGKTS